MANDEGVPDGVDVGFCSAGDDQPTEDEWVDAGGATGWVEEETVEVPRDEWESMQAEVARLRRQVRNLRTEVANREQESAVADVDPSTTDRLRDVKNDVDSLTLMSVGKR